VICFLLAFVLASTGTTMVTGYTTTTVTILQGPSPFPSASLPGVSIGTLPAGYETSGLAWHSRLQKLLTVSDGGTVSSMNTDGSGLFNWSVPGDLEAICVANAQSDYVYMGVEHPDSILEFSIRTGTVTRTFNLTPWMTGPDNQGLEGLTFVPSSDSAEGGVFYAGLQADGRIYLFELPIVSSSTSTSVTFKGTITLEAGLADLSDLSYDDESGVLLSVFDGPNRLKATTRTGQLLQEWQLPGTEQEGILFHNGALYVGEDYGGASTGRVIRYAPFSLPVITPPTRTLGTPTGGYWTGPVSGALPSKIPADALAKGGGNIGSYPTSFSWSGWDGTSSIGTNYMTPVRDQGGCGSCWAFAAIGDMEAQYQISKANPSSGIDLSEQNVLQCSGGSCSGWYLDGTLDYLKNSGTPDEACNPYNAADHACGTGRCSDYLSRTYKVTDWTFISTDLATIKWYLYYHGPVMVWMPVFDDFPWSDANFWQYYYYGHDASGSYGGHFVAIVGWNDGGSGGGWWVVRNSWGTTGGDVNDYGGGSHGGYFYMTMNPTTGFFGIYQEAAVISDVRAPPRASVSQPYVLGFNVPNVYSSSVTGDYSFSTTGWSATQASFQVTLAAFDFFFVIGTAQVWNDYSSIGSSIAITRDGVRVSGDMFAVGATAGNREIAVAIVLENPGAGPHTYTLSAKTDPGGNAWVSQPYLAGFKVSQPFMSNVVGDYSYSGTGWSPTPASFAANLNVGDSLFLIGTAQVWNDYSSIGSSIAITRDGTRVSGDMFAAGATITSRELAAAVAIDTPGAGSFTYALSAKTDPGGNAWVSQPYLLAFVVSSVYSSSVPGDFHYSSKGWSHTGASFDASVGSGESMFVIGTSQLWDDYSDVGSSIAITQGDARVSGDMFAAGATITHRELAVAIAVSTPGAGTWTYSLSAKTD
jgi:hypothetical protein